MQIDVRKKNFNKQLTLFCIYNIANYLYIAENPAANPWSLLEKNTFFNLRPRNHNM